MTDTPLSSMYSAESLKALEQVLALHRGMVWVDPATNQLAIKHITQEPDEETHGSYHPVTPV